MIYYCIECMLGFSVGDSQDDGDDFIRAVESWIIEKYNLADRSDFLPIYNFENDEYENDVLGKYGWETSEPEYLVRLLPWLWDCCADDNEQLDPNKFEDVLIILTIISLFHQEDQLSSSNDTKYIYIDMTLKFCEWLTTKHFVLDFFDQKIKFENYITASGVKSRHMQFEKKEYLQAIWDWKKDFLRILLLETFDAPEDAESFDFDKLSKIAPWKETRFSKSIEEWFDTIPISDIEFHFRQSDSYGIFSQAFKRFDQWDPTYRLMCYISLIRQTYLHNLLTSFLFNHEIITKLRGLIRLGHQALKHRISARYLTDLDNFEVEEIFYEFQMLSQTSSLFLQPTAVEIFHHCSSMEQIHDEMHVWESIDKCFQQSIVTKYCLVMSSLNFNSQVKFQQIINSFRPDSIKKDENWNGSKHGLDHLDLQSNAILLKQGVEEIIDGIKPVLGKSAIKRLRDFDVSKKKHLSLYNQLGIPTNIQSKTRGRRTEVLFYHQNKKASKLENEIEYLPKSLEKILRLFNDSNCVITAPYLVLVTLAHTIQFTQCINSLGNYSRKETIAEFGDAVNNIIGVLDKWGFESFNGLAEIRDLFREEDENSNVFALEKISRQQIVVIQNKLKEIYDKEIRCSLNFPNLVPESLLPESEILDMIPPDLYN